MVLLRGDLIKCVVIGDDNVGKTSMLMNYATNRFPSQHVPKLFDNYAGSLRFSGKRYTLQMIDTVAQGDGHEWRRLSYPGTDVFIVCFSLVKPETLLNVQSRWIREIKGYMGDTPFILMGTQADLRDDENVLANLRSKGQSPVKTREATTLSKRLGATCYVEFSPVMKKPLNQVMHEAIVSAFCRKDLDYESSCVIL